MHAAEKPSVLERFAIPGAVVIALVVGVLFFWFKKPEGQINCNMAADLIYEHTGDDERGEQIESLLLDHFAKEPHLDVTFAEGGIGKITGRQQFIGMRERSKLGKKLSGESMVEVATPQEYEMQLSHHINSLGQSLAPSNIGIHRVITDDEAVRTARISLSNAFSSDIKLHDNSDFLAKYIGTDPQAFSSKVAALATGTHGRFVLGNQFESGREVLAIFLVEKESPIHSGHLQEILQSEPDFDLEGGDAPHQFTFNFNDDGANLFHEFTARHVGHSAALIINDFAPTVPLIQAAVAGGAMVLSMGRGSDDSLGLRLVTSFLLARLGMNDVKFSVRNSQVICK